MLRKVQATDPAHLPVARSGASYRAREFSMAGHEAKLIAPQYLKPFLKRQKNDAADAETIVVAAQRCEMRFVPPENEEHQARAVLFRARERLVDQRPEPSNALRLLLCEYGHANPLLHHNKAAE
jgi:transposase